MANTTDWIFLSHTLCEKTPMYGDREGFCIQPASSIASGQSSNSQKWMLPNHIGTHIDVSRHFYDEGTTIDEQPAKSWIFQTPLVLDCDVPSATLIGPDHLQIPDSAENVDCLFLKTGFERFRAQRAYWEDNPGLHPDLADWLRKRCPRLRAIGLDAISITSWRHREQGRAAHLALLRPEHPFVLVEDMKLSTIKQGSQLTQVIILPLRTLAGDGGPATIIGKLGD